MFLQDHHNFSNFFSSQLFLILSLIVFCQPKWNAEIVKTIPQDISPRYIPGRISGVELLQWDIWNSTATPNHSIAPTQSISRVWHPPQFVRLNRILFHPGDSELLLMLIISRSLTIYTSSPHWQQYIRTMNAEISETTEVQMAFTQRPSPVNKTPEIQTLLFVFFVHMGQFLQGGKKGRLMSFFFFKSRASVWPNLMR